MLLVKSGYAKDIGVKKKHLMYRSRISKYRTSHARCNRSREYILRVK